MPKRTGGFPPVALTPEVVELLRRDCVVAVGVSGGKDSVACALAVDDYLNAIGHSGPRVLIHADLGAVEWQDSLPCCRHVAEHLGWELIVVQRKAGDMLDRWRGRWTNNVARYSELSCVKLILPWSTPSMRFCTSELKVDVITAALKKRFPDQDIVNVAGIRRQESDRRRKMPVSSVQAKLRRVRANRAGLNWNAIIEWDIQDVFARIEAAGLRLHEAYTRYGCSRVSCVCCIMSSWDDLVSATRCEDNRDVYVSMVELEAASTFAFQGNRWLADVTPYLLPLDLVAAVASAKAAALAREEVEARIPAHLLYSKGWPTLMPTTDEADLLAEVRRSVSSLVGLRAQFTEPDEIIARYAELMAQRRAKADGAALQAAAE